MRKYLLLLLEEAPLAKARGSVSSLGCGIFYGRITDFGCQIRCFMSTKSELPAKHNLPAQLTPLIGREQEVSTACALLRRPEVRLMTLTGTGGIGKTRLGLQIASAVLPDFSDGVFFIPLASIRNPELVIPVIAQILGLRGAGDWSQKEHLQTFLHEKYLLLL